MLLVPDCSDSDEFSGWVFGSLMMPTLAQRVWPSRRRPRFGDDTARRSRPSVDERVTQGGGVVAEFADLGGFLVDEREHRVAFGVDGRHDGPVLEQRVGATLGDECGERVGIDVVIPHVEVDARRVATSDLEPVDRRERLLCHEIGTDGATSGASRPASASTSRAVRKRSLRIAHSTSASSISSAFAASSRAPDRLAPFASSSASRSAAEGVEPIEPVGQCSRRARADRAGRGRRGDHAVRRRPRRRTSSRR